MINFKPKIPAMLGALAVLTAGAAHAELLEYTFKAPDGTQRSLTPNANYANPTGNISFALISAFVSWGVLCIFYLLFKHVHKECFHYANDTCKEESPGQSDSGA